MEQTRTASTSSRLSRAFNAVGFARTRAAKWIDSFWGYDVFIAHRRADAAPYALALHEELKQHRISSFIDRVVYGAGDSLIVATRRHVTKSTVFVLVASPQLLIPRRPTDWVREEVATYLETHHADPKLIVLDFGGTVARAATNHGAEPHPIIGQIESFIRLNGKLNELSTAPTATVVEVIHRQLDGRRRDRSRLRLFQRIAAALGVLLVSAIALGLVAVEQRNLAELRLSETLRVDSRRLAGESRRQLEAGVADLAVILAREALGAPIAKNVQTLRPYTPEAAIALIQARAYRPLATDMLSLEDSTGPLVRSPDGGLLLLSPGRGRAQLVAIESRRPQASWIAHKDRINAAAFNPRERTFATAAYDGAIKLWQLDTQNQLAEIDHGAPVRSMAFSPDGAGFVTGDDKGNLRAWHGQAPDKNAVESTSCSEHRKKDTDDGAVRAIAYNSDGLVAAACGTAAVFSWKFGEPLRFIRSFGESVSTLAFSPDGALLVIGYESGVVQAWIDATSSAATGTVLWKFEEHGRRITNLAFSADGSVVATASNDATGTLLDAKTGRRLQSLNGHTTYVTNTVVALDRGEAMTSSDDNTVRFWQITNPAVTIVAPVGEGGVTSMAFNPVKDEIALASWEGGLSVVSTDTGALLKRMRPKGSSVQAVAFSPNGNLIATGSVDDTLDNGVVTIWDAGSREAVYEYPSNLPAIGGPAFIAFSPDSRELAVGQGDGSVTVLDIASKEVTEALKTRDEVVVAVAYSTDGKKLLALSSAKRLTILDRTSKKSIEVAVQEDGANSTSFSSAGARIVVAGRGGTGVYDAESGKRLVSLPRQSGSVNDAVFSPDGKTIATATADGYATVWESERVEPLDSYFLFDPRLKNDNAKRSRGDREIESIRFSPDGRSIAIGCSDGTMRLWRPTIGTFASVLNTALRGRRLSEQEKTEFGLVD